MANTINLDFGGAPPAQGSAFDKVPAGAYVTHATKLEQSTTSTGKPQIIGTIEILEGPMKGKKVRDNFIIARPNTNDSKFGLQRFHAFIVACGAKEQSKAVSVDLDAFLNRPMICEIEDSVMPANEQYPNERVTSRPAAYYLATDPKAPKPMGPGAQIAAPPSANGASEAPAAQVEEPAVAAATEAAGSAGDSLFDDD